VLPAINKSVIDWTLKSRLPASMKVMLTALAGGTNNTNSISAAAATEAERLDKY